MLIQPKILRFDKVLSTNDEAYRLAERGAEAWTCVVADMQTAGRGRLKRVWLSEKGNLYISIVLRPSLSSSFAPHLNFVAALAIYETLQTIIQDKRIHISLKWPNDVLVDGLKISGILTELSAAKEKVNFIIVGVGINVNQLHFSPEITALATSLKKVTGEALSIDRVLETFLSALQQIYTVYLEQGFSPIQKRWDVTSGLLGKKVEINDQGKKIQGTFQGLSETGALRLKQKNSDLLIYTGDFFCHRCLAIFVILPVFLLGMKI